MFLSVIKSIFRPKKMPSVQCFLPDGLRKGDVLFTNIGKRAYVFYHYAKPYPWYKFIETDGGYFNLSGCYETGNSLDEPKTRIVRVERNGKIVAQEPVSSNACEQVRIVT